METETTTVADEGNPLNGMDPEMAAHPQPVFKVMRDEMPVMEIELGSSRGVMLSRKAEID